MRCSPLRNSPNQQQATSHQSRSCPCLVKSLMTWSSHACVTLCHALLKELQVSAAWPLSDAPFYSNSPHVDKFILLCPKFFNCFIFIWNPPVCFYFYFSLLIFLCPSQNYLPCQWKRKWCRISISLYYFGWKSQLSCDDDSLDTFAPPSCCVIQLSTYPHTCDWATWEVL